MKKCDSYRTKIERHYLTDAEKVAYTIATKKLAPGYSDIEVGVCYDTKECDECRCGGDETKCDFYPEKRKKKPTRVKVRVVKTSDWLTRGMTDKEIELEKKLALMEFESLRAFNDIEDLVLDYCGVDPAYLLGKDEEENELWEMCCKILEAISTAKKRNWRINQ